MMQLYKASRTLKQTDTLSLILNPDLVNIVWLYALKCMFALSLNVQLWIQNFNLHYSLLFSP